MAERFETTIQLEGKTATFFEVPLDVPAVFGRARPPVRVTIGGHSYRSTIAVRSRWLRARFEDAVFGASDAARRHRLYFAKPSY